MMAIVKNEMSDVKLVKGFQRGDKRMAEVLFARFCSGLVYFCMQYLRNQQLVDKIVADCFVNAWNKRKEFCDLSSLKMFLYKTARSACSDYQAGMNNRLRWQGEIDRLSGKYECLFADRHMIIGELMNKNLLNVHRLRVLQKKIYHSERKEEEP